jgi:hypothetical protein
VQQRSEPEIILLPLHLIERDSVFRNHTIDRAVLGLDLLFNYALLGDALFDAVFPEALAAPGLEVRC